MSGKQAKRLIFIDVARTYAIFLALLSHIFAATGFLKQLGTASLMILQYTRMATPLFVFMFGFMIEFVYVRRVEKEGFGVVSKRLLSRSFMCYVAYVLIGGASLVGGQISAGKFFDSLLFFSNVRFGNILRIYTVILVLAPFIIRLRLRFGVKLVVASLIALIVSYPAVQLFQSVNFGTFNRPMNVLFGVGPLTGGPSAYGALSFVLAGMIAASSLSHGGEEKWHTHVHFYTMSLGLVGLVLFLGTVLIQENSAEAWLSFVDYTYRKNNEVGYYIIGVLCSVLLVTLLYFFIGSRELPKFVKYILPLGTSSLLSYTSGNLLLNILGERVKTINLFIFTLLFFIVVLMLVLWTDKIQCACAATDLMCCKEKKLLS